MLELSSYQLETTWSLAPDAAAMLNLSEDHLDRYAGLAAYAEAKARVFQGAGVQVLNRCDSASMALALPGRTQLTFGLDAPEMPEDFGLADAENAAWLVRGKERILAVADLPLAGAHNASNALAACALAVAAGVPLAALAEGLKTFRGLPHRMQRVAVRGGVEWLDDSKGTNVGATVAALNGLASKAVLILGGEGKGQNFAPLVPAIRERARACAADRAGRRVDREGDRRQRRACGTHGIHGESGQARRADRRSRARRCCCRRPARASTCSATTGTAARPSPRR